RDHRPVGREPRRLRPADRHRPLDPGPDPVLGRRPAAAGRDASGDRRRPAGQRRLAARPQPGRAAGRFDHAAAAGDRAGRQLARGEGIWRDFDIAARRRQLVRMIALVDELYPTFRWFLYDGAKRYSVPFTVFGPKRVAIYVGHMYLVFNSTEHIRMLTGNFDDL